MNKFINLKLRTVAVLLAFAGGAVAQNNAPPKRITLHQTAYNIACPTIAGTEYASRTVTHLDQRDKTVLMADEAISVSGNTGPALFNIAFKRIWVSNWRKTEQIFTWKVSSPRDADYQVEFIGGVHSVRLSGHAGDDLVVNFPGKWLMCSNLGTISLKKGESTLKLQMLSDIDHDCKIRSLDLLPVDAKEDYEKRVAALRSDAGWMRGDGYGVMLQYGAWSYPEHGPKKPWEDEVNTFDTEKFAKMVDEDMGARWVIWSITWRGSRFPMPLKSVDAIVSEHTTKRDLMADLAASLNKRNIKLFFYYHPGHEDYAFWNANWQGSTPQEEKDLFIKNWMTIVSEIGERYGSKLAGWFFDDGTAYSPAPFEKMTKAAKAGFPCRLVSYNNWRLPMLTDFQDIQFGEGFKGNEKTAVGSDGIYKSGSYCGLQAHGMFIVNSNDWGIFRPEQKTYVQISAEKAAGIIKEANKRGQLMSLNFDMYQDGVVTPETLEMFKKLKVNVY